jgi:hypothetical protein
MSLSFLSAWHIFLLFYYFAFTFALIVLVKDLEGLKAGML